MQLLFLGDFLYDYEGINQDILDLGNYFKSRDISLILNCEGSLSVAGSLKKNVLLFQNENRIGEILQILNTKAVCLANNHIMDGQEQGLRRLLEILDRCKIGYFGAGTDLPKALRPLIIEDEKRQKIGLLGFGWNVEKCVYATAGSAGVAPLTEEIVIYTIKQVRKNVNHLIVIPHWGYEYEIYPLPVHRKLAHDMIDAGASMVIGNHPHTVQAYEEYMGKPIYYSIGNFYFGSQGELRPRKYKNSMVNTDTGLGVLLTTESFDIRNLIIQSFRGKITIREMPYKFQDLTSWETNSYNKQYNHLRTSHMKPSLFEHQWKWLVNPVKLYLYELQNSIIEFLLKVLSHLHIYQLIRRVRFLRKFSHLIRGGTKMIDYNYDDK